MTRKHYVRLAQILARPQTSPEARRAVREIALDLAAYLASENPRFDMGRFIAACGLDSGEES